MIQRVSIFLLTAVLFVTAALPAAAQSQENGAVIVRVSDAATGTPIDNADVFLLGGDTPQNSLTNAKGLLIFDDLQPAIYRIKVEANGYKATESTDVEVGEGQRVDVAVKMTAAMKTIAAVVAHSSVSVSVESVTADSAQRKISQSLSDALNKIAGVTVDNNMYGSDSAFNISLRGADASRTSYSIDGVQMSGAAGQAMGGLQDLFSGASVNFSPSATSTAGAVNFFTIQPTKLWNYGFTGIVGNYGNTMGTWTLTGGAGKAAFALEHTAGGVDSPITGMYYADQSGQAYTHVGGMARTADLFKVNFTLSPVSSVRYMLLKGNNRSSAICSNDTTLLPCSAGPDNGVHGISAVNSLGFSSLAGHLQYNVFLNAGSYRMSDQEPNRTINGVLMPSYASSSYPWNNIGIYLSQTKGRHTFSGGGYTSESRSTTTGTYNVTGKITASRIERFGNLWISDKVKSNDKLAWTHTLSEAAGTGAGTSLEVDEQLTWQPKRLDVFQAEVSVGSAEPAGSFFGTIGDPASADYDCHNGSVYVQGPSDEAVRQASLQYSLGWRHTLKGGFISANVYRNKFGGQTMRAGVPFAAEPPSLFPNGAAAFLNGVQNVWAQPTICGSTPFDPSRVYISQLITGVSQVAQGLDVSGEIPLGKNVVALPSYAVTNSYISSLDPRLVGPGSYYAPGVQLPHTPLHTAGLVLDGLLAHASAEWLVDAQYTSANNRNNLPGYTVYNAGLIFKMAHGSISLLESNVFGSHTGLFTTYQGVNPMPLQGGGTFAYATTPLPPRSFTVQYQVRWHQHQAPPTKKP